MYQVMIVDDDVNVRKCLRKMIPWESIGCALVVEASDGEEGLGYFLEKRPDAVITDLRMPGMDGDVFCKKIRAVSDKCAIILLSAYESFAAAQLMMHYGVLEYLLKPISRATIDQLTEILKKQAVITASRKFLSGMVRDADRREEFMEQLRKKNSDYFSDFFRDLSVCTEVDPDLLRTAAGVMLNLLFQVIGDGEAAAQQRKRAFLRLESCVRKMDMITFLSSYFEEYLTGSAAEPQDDMSHVVMEQIKEYVAQHLQDSRLNVPAIANHFDFSVDYVGRLFKKHTGVTLISYISSVRIEQACRLLKETRFSVAEIAKMVGYSNASYFCRVFKDRMNLSPNDYRLRSN